MLQKMHLDINRVKTTGTHSSKNSFIWDSYIFALSYEKENNSLKKMLDVLNNKQYECETV